MNKLNQFFKGEAIKITVEGADGSMLSGEFDKDGNRGSATQKYAGLRCYPDFLDIRTRDESDVRKFVVQDSGDDEGKVFTLSGAKTMSMDAGPYTLELIYGTGDSGRVIIKKNYSFVLVESVYSVQNSTTTGYYEALVTKPTNFESNITSYYKIVNGEYVSLTVSEVIPFVWTPNYYFRFVPYNS